MNNAKKIAKRLKKIAIWNLLDAIDRSLHRQADAAERCEELYLRSLELQELQLSLSKKSVGAAQEVAHITKQNYADRLLAATRQACQPEAPDA
ncbi:MAG: hypothetical protein KAX46_08955 [Chromatiaceae bacterium]|nr:hypothetical protein [Chromatiaceae bacterium]